jgi:hypothetical protein
MSYIEENRERVFCPDDKVWMAERKKEWRFIKNNLKVFINNSRHHKEHKHWFFYGRFIDGTDDRPSLGSGHVLFYLWYWPERSLDAYKSIIFDEMYRTSDVARLMIRKVRPTGFPGEYGMMGGREALILKALMPNLDWNTPIPSIKPEHEKIQGLYPPATVFECIEHTTQLISGWDTNPYAPGQYLWEHLNYNFANYLKLCEADKHWHLRIYYFKVLLRFLLDFHEREGAHLQNVAVVDLRNSLVERFESRGFCEPIMTLWDEQLIQHNAGAPHPYRPRTPI